MDNSQNRTPPRAARKGRWSVVDTVLLLLFLVIVAAVVYRVVSAAYEEGKDGIPAPMYEVYFEVDETNKNILEEIRGFDTVYFYETDQRLGYVGMYEDTVTGEHRVALNLLSVAGAVGADRATATGCMICTEGTMLNGSLFVGGSGRYLTPGSVLEVRTDRVLMTIRITSVREHT